MYFDRHTLSIKAGQLSMFTLDGRMRFQLELREQDEQAFHLRKLREVVLARRADGVFELSFLLAEVGDKDDGPTLVANATLAEIPEYVVVEETV